MFWRLYLPQYLLKIFSLEDVISKLSTKKWMKNVFDHKYFPIYSLPIVAPPTKQGHLFQIVIITIKDLNFFPNYTFSCS